MEAGVYINGHQQNGCQFPFPGTMTQTQGYANAYLRCGQQQVLPVPYPTSRMQSQSTSLTKPGQPVQPASSNIKQIIAGSLQTQNQTTSFARAGPVPTDNRRNSILTGPSVQVQSYMNCHPRSEQQVQSAAVSDGRNSSHSNSPLQMQMQSYSNGYKHEETVKLSDGWNSPVSCSPAPVKPRSLNAQVVGTKASKMSGAICSGFVATKLSCNGIFDLVSGFDKHTASLKAEQEITAVLESRPTSTTWPENSHFFAGSIGESPYITSKSFDDMHRCLGINLPSNPSHLDLNETKFQTNVKHDKQSTLPSESPYITSKSFDEMHKCLGIGLPSSTLSHFDLNGTSAGAGSNLGIDIHATTVPSITDPRTDKLPSAFSPFDATIIMQDSITTAHTTGSDLVGNDSNSRYGHAENYFNLGQRAVDGSNANRSYQAPFEYGLSLLHGGRDTSHYPKEVSASEHSSDRGVNSSPDCTDVQSD